MPRPRPARELKPRNVRLNDEQFAKLQVLGHDWLRALLDRKVRGVGAAIKRARNETIAADPRADAEVAKAHGLCRQHVYRIRKIYRA
jgi:hypothetical protein